MVISVSAPIKGQVTLVLVFMGVQCPDSQGTSAITAPVHQLHQTRVTGLSLQSRDGPHHTVHSVICLVAGGLVNNHENPRIESNIRYLNI